MKNIILDTDLGGDPDDLFALLLSLKSSELNINLIVTNDEHKGDRARFAKKFLSKYGKEIPIVSGIDLGNEKDFVVGKIIKDFKTDLSKDFLKKIKRTIEKNEITYYVCIGPQSNLLKFIEKFPKLNKKVEILIMGGAINYRHKKKAEHNIRLDVDSAKKVFNSNWNKKYVLSDVTFKKEISIDKNSSIYLELKNLNKPSLKILLDSMNSFFEKRYPSTIMHDPLTLSYLIDEKIIKFENKKIKMNEKGIMTLSPKGKETSVSKSANYELFWKYFKKRILKD